MNRYIRFMENIESRVVPAHGRRRLQAVPAYIVKLGGRPVALPLNTLIQVLVDDGRTGSGTVRYVGSDGRLAVHFGCDPANYVWEFPRDRCRPVHGGIALLALEALLAIQPPVTCDLDTSEDFQPLIVVGVPA